MSSEHERSEYAVRRMDCPSEERMIRLALERAPAVRKLAFDLGARRLSVWHDAGVADQITGALEPLGLGAELLETTPASLTPSPPLTGTDERRTLWIVLAINATMFAGELVAGWLVQSVGLLADSLDMFADAAVYGLSLHAVGRSVAHEQRAARASGTLQLALAIGAFVEVGRRALAGSEPDPGWMIAVSTLALAANVACLVLVSRHREGGAHMKASYIFSTNDVLANVGVIGAAVLVAWTGSHIPDLVIGTAIGVLVLTGAVRILRLR